MGIIEWLKGQQKEPAERAPAGDDGADEQERPAGAGAKAKPAEPEERSAESKAKPEEPKAKPAEPKAKPAEGRRAELEHDLRAAEMALLKVFEAVPRIEAAVQPLVGMLQATAKSAARSDQDRRQQFLDLRAHISGETDRLVDTLRERIAEESALQIFKGVLPALDELDHVLREEALEKTRGVESMRLVRRKLRDAFSRLGIEEITVEEGVTQFDPHLHEGKPHDGDDAPSLSAGTVSRLERTGYIAGDKVIRCALVTVVKG